ncbi:DUF6694 family lipoprotein [Pseudomonas viridiflava]|uniref:DUF6694 family lipoprotein n=1 Tax=Pseudomonas viridiflava TaxID=33069 RepID=UPI000F037B71|nr:DUF6694 family lipoprotein [Pseudomonas viridiflava]
MRRTAVLLVSALALVACGQPKLDGSSEEALKKSIAKVSESLSGDKKEQFKSNVQLVAISQVDLGGIFKGEANAATTSIKMLSALDGKTADDVASEAKRIIDERAVRQREQAIAEIKDLTEKLSKSEAAKSQLVKFAVVKSRFYLREDKYSYRPQPIIELVVRNDTDKAVSRAYFKGTLASPGRAVPWLVDDFNYEISGGLEPGETAAWNLSPNMFGEWGKVRASDDAVFTVEVIRLDGADKAAIYDATGLTEREQKRLGELKSKYAGG